MAGAGFRAVIISSSMGTTSSIGSARGGETKLANLVSLCRVHHRMLHEGGTSVALVGGELVFRNRDGAVLIAAPAPAAATPLPRELDPWLAVATDNLRPLDWHSIGGAFADL